MARLNSITDFLDDYLETAAHTDTALNGLQLESANGEISKIAVAVDSGLRVIEEALRHQAQLLIVHHGFFWGKPYMLNGALGRKAAALFRGGCSLYAAHLPLDGHAVVGNGVEAARYFGLEQVRGFFEVAGRSVGARGTCVQPVPLEYFSSRARELSGSEPLLLAFGKKDISSVGVVTGSGSSALPAAQAAGLDLLITGEPKQEAYHTAQDLGLNVLFAGHYATEIFGVKALAAVLQQKFDVATVFIDQPTGI